MAAILSVPLQNQFTLFSYKKQEVTCECFCLVFTLSVKQAIHDSTSLANSAFPDCSASPVENLVEHIISLRFVPEEPDEASKSYLSVSPEDTAEQPAAAAVVEPLGSLLLASQAALAAELEWDAGCVLEEDDCGHPDMAEELQHAAKGNFNINVGLMQVFRMTHLETEKSVGVTVAVLWFIRS